MTKKKTPILVNLNQAQRDWVKQQSEKTGDTMTAVIRRLIQNQMEAK